MTSKKFPPIPPFYPAPDEGWNYPQPGPGFPAPKSPVQFSQDGQAYVGDPAQPPLEKVHDAATTERNFAGSLKYFQFEGRAVRHELDVNGVPWFVLSDVCVILEVGNPSDVAARLDGDEKADLDLIDTSLNGSSQVRRFKCVNESGLYAVIMTSRKESAKRFRKWVTGEVLPSIRKTGGYGNREPAKTLSRAELARNWADAEERAEASEAARLSFAKQVADLGNQNIGLSQELHTTKGIATLAANGVSLLTALLGSQESIPLRDAANQLEQPQHEFNEWLFRKGGWIYRSKSRSGRWKPHATAIAKGWLGDKQFIRPKDNSAAPVLLTPEMGFVDPNIFYIFRDVEVTPAGMVRILQYADHPKPDAPALIRARQEIRV
jgi:prophage antirepressor-like protein